MGGNTPDAWNREHVWASSHGFASSSQHGHTDAHHLRASDKSVNADREDHDFGYAPAPNGIADTECTHCREDVSRGVWEAPDVVKGDIARMMFYVDTRYDGTDVAQTDTPDVSLVPNTTSGGTAHGLLCDLVEWHLNDPVSNEESMRNDVIYSWQGNRNPFIDRPDYVARIWGPQCGLQIPPLTTTKQVPLMPMFFLLLAAVFTLARGIVRSRTQMRARISPNDH